jgi:hypothetical protein
MGTELSSDGRLGVTATVGGRFEAAGECDDKWSSFGSSWHAATVFIFLLLAQPQQQQQQLAVADKALVVSRSNESSTILLLPGAAANACAKHTRATTAREIAMMWQLNLEGEKMGDCFSLSYTFSAMPFPFCS